MSSSSNTPQARIYTREEADKLQLDQLIRNKRRALALFAPDINIPLQSKPDEVPAKKKRIDIKLSTEYGRLTDLPTTDEGQADVVTGVTVRSGFSNRPLAAITGSNSTSNLMLTNAVDNNNNVNAGTTIASESGSAPRSNIQQKRNTVISNLPKATAGKAAAPAPGLENQQAPNKVNLSIYREKDQIVSTTNPNNRLRGVEKPQWHRPWKLARVIAGHTGWVRSVVVDPSNEWFVTSGQDRLIKFWDMATGSLKLSLTGHSATVRALDISKHHPYFYSGGEDNEVRCWDLNTNKIIRTYHGHLSAVYSLKLHPTIDVLASGGRDGTVRIWDIRSRTQIFALSHEGAVNTIVSQQSEPQFISGSADNTVKLWDLAAGKSMVTLTHHKKSIRALAIHPNEYTFVSCSTGDNKVWRCPAGVFERNIYGHESILNTCAIRDNQDGSSVLVAGGDDGYLHFWDWKTGYLFQSIEGKPQPGSLSSENAIFSLAFDQSQTRLITAECDKTIKIYKQDFDADENSHPIGNWRQQLMKNRKK